MMSWRKFLPVAAVLGLASTAAEAQYAPAPYQTGPIAPPVTTPQPYTGQTYGTPVQPAYARPTFASQSQTLHAALEAARGRRMEDARAYQSSLTDPVARKIVEWAMVDVFGAQMDAYSLERANRELQGWPREEARRQALERFRAPTAPGAPVPYSVLRASSLEDGESRGFTERRLRMNAALKIGDAAGAYSAIANHSLTPGGAEFAEAESFAGWLALNKLRNPSLAAGHFARLDANVKSPVSKGRAGYWRGRAAEAAGDAAGARNFYLQAAQHTTTFYGQLAAERAGLGQIVITPDPVPTDVDRAMFEGSELGQALRLLSQAGEKSLVRVFGLHLGDTVRTPVELAVVMDAIQGLGEQELSLLAYRRGAQRNIILHERGYPLRTPPSVMGGAEPAFVLAITRQESQFDPRVRSSADARGMMQLLPGTGRDTARKIGVSWDESQLWNPEYNMRLGSAYLQQIADRFNGSYIMAAAGYNAGPGRPAQWIEFCGDPRSATADPLDFIECVPFSETRNYIMNVMSNVQMYRARLASGRAPITLSQDLKRGGYNYAVGGGYQTGSR